MATLTSRRRDDFATTLDTLSQCIDRNCFTIRHVSLTSDFLLGFHEFLKQFEFNEHNNRQNNNNMLLYDTWDNLDYYNSIEATIAINKEKNLDLISSPRDNPVNMKIDKVNTLEFWNCAIEDDTLTKEILADIIMVFPEMIDSKLESLRFSFNFLDDDTLDILSTALSFLYDLYELRITNNDLTYLSFQILTNIFNNNQFCQFKKTIKILDLSGNDGLIRDHENGLNAFKIFVNELLMNSNISYLRLAQYQSLIKDVHITILAKWVLDNDKLNTLDLSENKFDISEIKALCDVILNNDKCLLQNMILRDCIFGADGGDYFGCNLYDNYNLFELDVSGMDLEGFISFARSDNEICVNCLKLSNLCCRSQPNWYKLKMDDISDALIKIITKKCLYINKLYLNRGDLNNDEVMDLCAFLCNHSWIRYLNLCNNFITNECIKSLSFFVKQSRKEAITSTIKYCNNIVDAVQVLLFEQDEETEITVNTKQIIIAYLAKYNRRTLNATNITDIISNYLDNFNFANKFTYDLGMIILEYLHILPSKGVKSILLSGNSLNPIYGACFRNTDLISDDMFHKMSQNRKFIIPNATTINSSLGKRSFVRTMY